MKSIGGILVSVLLLSALAGCGEGRREAAREQALERAAERSRLIAGAEWTYEREQRPPERGDTGPIEEDRCRITLPGEERQHDVACGFFMLALEPQVDSAWVEQLVQAVGGVVVEWQEIPGWATRLDDPVPYVLASVPTGQEPEAIRRALASEGVRFVDVRRIQRRRP
jgi:hypothetical protein